MQWIALVVVFVLYSICCYFTFDDRTRAKWWYVPSGVFLGIVCNTIWLFMTRSLDDKEKIYFYALFWDAMIVVVFYGMPILLFGVKLNKWGLLGLALMITGLTIMKIAKR